MFKIEMLPAGHGDSLLVAYGSPDTPHYVLIDGGPYYAYRNKKFVKRKTLNNRIQKLVRAGGQLELLVTTHIDADHIEAVVKLLGSRPSSLDVQDVWFNAWRHLTPQPEDLLGPVEAEMLSALIKQERLPWNAAFDGEAIAVKPDKAPPTVTLTGGLQLTLLSPTPAELYKLRETWELDLREHGLDPDSPEEALERLKKSRRLRPVPSDYLGERRPDVDVLAGLPFESDDSLANGSSIAFIAEFEGKRCLFAGDAHPSVLEASVQRLLDEQGESRLHLDAFKISHHGSKDNLSLDLLELLACKRYLVSTNGSYFGHPDEEAIARIIVHGGDSPVICFNYHSRENAVWDDDILKADYGYKTIYPEEEHLGLIIEL